MTLSLCNGCLDESVVRFFVRILNKKWFEKKQADKTWISSGTCWFRLCDFLILLGNLDPLPGNCVFWVPLVKFDIFLDFDFLYFRF